MGDTINGFGKFLHDALAYQIGTYDDNGGGDDEFAAASVHADLAEVLSLDGDVVTVKLVGTLALTIEPTDFGFAVLVPHDGNDDRTAAGQNFVFDALSLYLAYGFCGDDPAESHGDEVADTIRPAVKTLEDSNDHIKDADGILYIGDVMDDNDHAVVEFRPSGI